MSVSHLMPMTVILMPAATTQLEALTVHVCLDLKAMEHSAMVTLNIARCVSDDTCDPYQPHRHR